MAITGNTSGLALLSRGVTFDTYAGPPLVLFGTGVATGGDGRFAAVWAMAASFSNVRTGAVPPMVACEELSDLATLRVALLAARKFSDSAHMVPPSVPVTPYDGRASYPPFCGPILCIPQFIDSDYRQQVWDWAATCARSTGGSPWGIGLSAVSSASPWHSPPIYQLSATGYVAQVGVLTKLWSSPPSPTTANYTALAALETARPGVGRLVNPSLVGWVTTARPV